MNSKKTIRYTALAVAFITAAVIFSSCFMGELSSNMITPEIRAIGLPDASIVDSVTLKVTGAGMDPVEVSYSSVPSVINLSIPEGNDRTFELTVGTGPAYTGTIATYSGTATADINADGAVVTLDMGIGSTKIIAPDPANHRIVQIDDMSGTGWSTVTGTDLGFTNEYYFSPYDIDIDQFGNIYIANNEPGEGTTGGIYIIDSINFTSVTPLPRYYNFSSGYDPISAVAVDNKNNRIYGITSGAVYYWELNGLPGASILFVTISSDTITGITVDDDGNVYLGGHDGNSWGFITKYDSLGNPLISTSTFGGSDPVSDITIFKGEVYATINFSNTNARIEKFNQTTLAHTAAPFSYGQYSASPSISGDFVGPFNFLATKNNSLTIIDSSGGFGRLISFDDILGTNWITYGSYGFGTGEFWFFYSGA